MIRADGRLFFLAVLAALACSFPLPASAQTGSAEEVRIAEISSFIYVCLPAEIIGGGAAAAGTRNLPAGLLTEQAVLDLQTRLLDEIGRQNVPVSGQRLILVLYDETGRTGRVRVEAGVEVAGDITIEEPLLIKEWAHLRAADSRHVGPIETIDATLDRIRAWMEDRGLRETGPMLVRFLDEDPAVIRPEFLQAQADIPCPENLGSILAQRAPVRMEAAMDSQALWFLEAGALVEVLGSFADFYEVRSGDKTGFVHRSLLDTAAPVPPPGTGRPAEEEKPVAEGPKPKKPILPKGGRPAAQPGSVPENESAGGPRRPQPGDQPIPPTRRMGLGIGFELSAYGSMNNGYRRGALDTFWQERVGDDTELVDSGSPAFFRADAAVYFPLSLTAKMGIGFGIFIPPSHALWGSSLYYGGRDEIVLSPMIFAVSFPLKLDLGGFAVALCPDMLIGGVSGSLETWSFERQFDWAPSGIGFGGNGGIDFMVSKFFGLSIRAGMRSLTCDLLYKNSDSETGWSQPLLNNGDKVKVDLSGTYAMFGLIIGF